MKVSASARSRRDVELPEVDFTVFTMFADENLDGHSVAEAKDDLRWDPCGEDPVLTGNTAIVVPFPAIAVIAAAALVVVARCQTLKRRRGRCIRVVLRRRPSRWCERGGAEEPTR
jgi:hypothetical protein